MRRPLIAIALCSTVALIAAKNAGTIYDRAQETPFRDAAILGVGSHADLGAGSTPSFMLASGGRSNLPLSGVSELSPGSDVTIGGVTASALWAYEMKKCTASTCTATAGAENLGIVSSGPDVTIGEPTPFTDDTKAVLFALGDYYEAVTAAFGEITTEDLMMEIVYRQPTTTADLSPRPAGKGSGSGDPGRYYLKLDDVVGSGVMRLRSDIGDGVTNVQTNGPQFGNEHNVWQLCHWFVDRSDATEGSKIYCNTETDTGADVSLVGTLANNGKVRIGTEEADAAPNNSHIAYVATYKLAGWFNSGTNQADWLAFHRERFAKLTGIWPDRAAGTALANTISRTSIAQLDILNAAGTQRDLFQVGRNWVRAFRRDVGGSQRTMLMPEDNVTNLFVWSEDFTQGWTLLNTTISSNGAVGPSNIALADGLIASAADVAHNARQVISEAGPGQVYVSFFAAAGNKNFAHLQNSNDAANDVWFNLTNCTVGTVDTDVNSTRAEDWGTHGGRKWCRLAADIDTEMGSNNIRMGPAEADNDATFLGDGATVSIWVFGATMDKWAGRFLTTYIRTGSSSAGRAQEDLIFDGLGNLGGVGSNLAGSMDAQIYSQGASVLVQASLLEPSDGGALTDNISFSVNQTGDVMRTIVNDGGVATLTANGATSVTAAGTYRIHTNWKLDLATVYRNSVLDGTDTGGTIVNDLDRLYIGANSGSDNHSTYFGISDIVVYPQVFGP